MATLAPSLAAFRAEVNARYPNRDKASDGWIGDPAHAARVSDHNPGARDLVHAFDLDEDLTGGNTDAGAELQWLVDHIVARRDPRVSYLIYERRMWRSYPKPGIPAWAPAPYSGVNAHRRHLHISILSTPTAEQDTRPWLPEDDMGLTTEEREWLDRELLVIRQKVETTYNQVNRKAGNILNALKALGVDVDVDEAELAAALAPLVLAQARSLSGADLDAIATAVNDEQHRRSAG